MILTLRDRMDVIPAALSGFALEATEGGSALTYSYDARAEDSGMAALMRQLDALGIGVRTVRTQQSSLEDIFVSLVHDRP